MIPVIEIDKVLCGKADALLMNGATQSGFLTLSGVDDALGLKQPRKVMQNFFTSEAARAATLRHKFDSTRPNVYRGFFPVDPGMNILVEGIDIGPDIAHPDWIADPEDPLTEPTPRPDLPGWEDATSTYYRALERVGMAVTQGLLRGLGADPDLAKKLFGETISTLRMLHYPEHPPEMFGPERRIMTANGERCVMTGAHTDSGFVTLLWQDATGGLQAESPCGWVDVPPAEGGLVVNFGQMLGDWSGGRMKATRHRVLGGQEERFSVPFFFEPGVSAVIAPLSGKGASFVYGDFLWARMLEFNNMKGIVRKRAV